MHGACVPPRRGRAGGGRLAGVRARRGPSIQTSTLILSPHPLLSSLPSAPNNLVRSTIQGRTDDPQFSARSAATSPCAPRSRRSVSSLEEPHIGTADWQASLEVYIDRVPRRSMARGATCHVGRRCLVNRVDQHPMLLLPRLLPMPPSHLPCPLVKQLVRFSMFAVFLWRSHFPADQTTAAVCALELKCSLGGVGIRKVAYVSLVHLWVRGEARM